MLTLDVVWNMKGMMMMIVMMIVMVSHHHTYRILYLLVSYHTHVIYTIVFIWKDNDDGISLHSHYLQQYPWLQTSIYLSIYLSIHPSIFFSIYLSVHIHTHLPPTYLDEHSLYYPVAPRWYRWAYFSAMYNHYSRIEDTSIKMIFWARTFRSHDPSFDTTRETETSQVLMYHNYSRIMREIIGKRRINRAHLWSSELSLRRWNRRHCPHWWYWPYEYKGAGEWRSLIYCDCCCGTDDMINAYCFVVVWVMWRI